MKTVHALATAIAMISMLASHVAGHGYMVQPKGRTTNTFGDPQDKHACDTDKTGTVTSFKSGEEIEVIWTRNNHIGGFIRYSIAPKNAATKANFDQNAFFYTCRESDCSLKQCKNKYCGDDSGSKDNEIKCKAKVKLPDYLQQGDYVLQWTWHAAGSSYGNIGWSTSNFKTCADINLTTSGSGTKPTCPTFVGGDRVTFMEKTMDDAKRTSQCFYFDDNGLGKNVVKYSDSEGYKRYMFGVPKEVQKCGGGASPSPSGGNSTSPAQTTKDPSSSSPVSPSKAPKPTKSGSKPATDAPATSTSAPSTDDGDNENDSTGGEGDNEGTEQPCDDDEDGNEDATPGTVAPWKQSSGGGRPKGGSGNGDRKHRGSRGSEASQY